MDSVNHFLITLARSSVEAGVLVVLVLVVQWIFQKQLAARWRCALWLLVVARLLLPFSFSSVTSVFNLLPRWTSPVQAAPAATPLPTVAAPPVKSSPTTAPPLEPMPPIPTTDAHGWSWSWPVAIFAVWLAGVILLAGYVLALSLRFWRRCAGLRPVDQPAAFTVLQECCARLKIRTSPALLESDEVSSPALHGLFHPRLLLPKGFAEKFSLEELRFVFLHELAHLKRRDLLVNWVMTAVQLLHWFNPLVWFAFARWRADRELACDAMALEAAGPAHNKEYGRTILRLLESFAHPMNAPGLVGILEDKRQLHRRIGMIASYVPKRGWPRLAFLLIGALAVVGLTDAQSSPRSATDLPIGSAATASNLTSGGSLNVGQAATTSNSNPAQQKDDAMIKSRIAVPIAASLLALATPATTVNLHGADTPPAAVPASQLPDELVGAWVLVGSPGHVGDAPATGGRYKLFTGSHWCMSQADPKYGVVMFHHGGTYQIKGNKYDETVEYADPSTMTGIGRTGKYYIQIDGDLLTDIGINNDWREVWKRVKPDPATAESPLEKELTGTWVCIKSKEVPDGGAPPGQDFKFFVDGHFCNTYPDPKIGVVAEHHGGTYTLDGDTYSETVDYANPDRMNLVGQTFKFNIKVQGDTLTLSGIGNPWNEVWKRAD